MILQINRFTLWTVALLCLSVIVVGSRRRMCEDSSRVNIKGNSDQRKVSLGSSLTLFCCIGANRPSELVWILPDGSRAPDFLKANGGNIFTFPDDGGYQTSSRLYLFFRNITIRQLGSYTCENARDSSSTSASVNIQQLDHIEIDAPSVQWVRLGKPGQLVCNARGHPNLKIAWYYRGMPVATESTNTILQGSRGSFSLKKGGRILSIKPEVEWGHGGQYMCKAEVATDSSGDLIKVKPITLSIYKSPEVIAVVAETSNMDRMNRPLAVEGKEIRIKCSVASYPDARIHWLKDHRPLRRADKRYKVTEKHQKNFVMESTLAVRQFRESDIGSYTCVAKLVILTSNITETSQKSLTLDAILRPRFTRNQKLNITDVEKSRVDMSCRAIGATGRFMDMKFYHNGKLVTRGSLKYGDDLRTEVEDRQKLKTLILTFQSVTSEDAGDYKCVVTTAAGRAEQNGALVVNFPPKISGNTKQAYGWRNHRTKLVCTAKGTPAPKWRWLLNGRAALIDGYVLRQEEYLNGVSSGSTLFVQPTFSNDRVFGQYTCIASNNYGIVNATSTLLRARRPGLPDITISEAHATSIRLQLAPPRKTGGAPLSHFQLRYKVFKGPGKISGHFFGPYDVALDRDLNIRGMMPHATYEFHIAAVSLLGAGLEQVVNFTTGAIGNPQPVKIVSDFYSSEPTIHFLKWKPNGNGGFPIRQYRIKLRPVKVNPQKPGTEIREILGQWTEYNVFNDLSYKLENLRPNTYYQVKVQARTAFGSSEKSHIFQTGSGPSALKSFYNNAGRSGVTGGLVAIVMAWSAHYQLGLRIDG